MTLHDSLFRLRTVFGVRTGALAMKTPGLIQIGLGLVLSHACAIAQVASSPVGTWKSGAVMNREWDVPASLTLTVANVDAAQRASGRFILFFPSGGGFPNYCRNGPVNGHFDGTSLKLTSEASNLCAERLFDLKLDGDRLVGVYRGAAAAPVEVTFTRQK